MFDPMFVPPRHNPALVWFANTFVTRLGRLFGNVHGLTADEETLDLLHELRGERALICPNHPTETDPIVVYWLGCLVKQHFNFLATRETLEGPRGKLLNNIGVYSVIRGFADRESIRYTRKLLAEQDRKVVIFPEGLVYEHNDKLLEFQNGVAQMGFWAMDDLKKAGKEPALPIVPVAVRYRCKVDPMPYIERGLSAVEHELGLKPGNAGLYERLLKAGGEVLADLERAEGIKTDPEQPLGDRIVKLRRSILERVAHAANVEICDSEAPGEQLHHITNELRAWVGTLPDEHSEYEERLYRQRATVAAPLFKELLRLHNFVALSGDYVASEPTAERFLEVLGRLQKEVLGSVKHAAPLRAIVKAAPPIRLEERYDEYKERKREVVAGVTDQLEDTIRGMLQELRHEATPLGK